MARARRGVARAAGRRRLGLFLLVAGGLYLLMAAEGAAAPPAVTTTVTALGYTENAAATAVDPGLAINEPEADDILGATVRIVGNYQSGEDVLAFTDQLGINGAWNPGTGILTLSGTTTAAGYETALRTVTYQNTSDAPDPSTRTVQIVVTDANSESGSATRDIVVTAVDDPLDVTTTGGSLAYSEGAAATAVDTGITVVDLDHDVTGATVRITGNYVNGEDVLAFTNQLGISGSWDAGTGTLTLTGTTTPAGYQTALRTVTYANAGENPSTLPRSVTFTVTTPGNSDNGVRVIAISAVNDAPDAGGATTVTDPGGGAANVLEDSIPGAANIRLTPPTLADVDSPAPTQVRIIAVTGGTLAQADGSVIGLGSGGSLLTLAGGSVDLRFTPAANRDAAGSLDYVVVDASNSGINSSASTATVPIVPVNDAPGLVLSGGSAAFVENGAPVIVDGGADINDIDNANMAGATLQITGNYVNGEDLLSFTDQLGITGAWTAGTGTLTLSGASSIADYETAVRSVAYSNVSDNPSTSIRTVTVIVDDGSALSGAPTRTITVAATNDAPTVTPSGGSAAYTENDAAVTVDAGIATADVDTPTLASASVQITGNYVGGEDVLAFTNQSGISGSWDAGTGTLSLSGTATVAQYETALRTITYLDTSDAPSTSARTVTFVVDDGGAPSSPGTRGVTVTAVNDAPALAGTGGSVSYTENAAPLVVDGGLVVADLDNTSLASATASISAGYWNGEDELAFANQAGITGSWDAGTGALTLSGSASVGNYATALRSITYANTSDAPTASTRTIAFTVSDGTAPGNVVSRAVTVTPVNDLPAVTMTAGAVTYVEGAVPVDLDDSIVVADADDATLSRARVTISSGYRSTEDVLDVAAAGGITASWDASAGVLTLTGAASPSTYQTVLRSVTYENSSPDPATALRTVTVLVDDPSGSGPAATRQVAVTPVNDPPVARDDTASTLQRDPVTVEVLANDTDVEDDALTVVAATSEAGGAATITAGGNVVVTPDAAFVGTLAVDYTVSDGTANDEGTITVAVTPAADIAVAVTARPDPVRVDDDVDVEIVVRSDGPGTAIDPVVTVDAGDGNLVRAARTAGGRCDYYRGEARCTLPGIANGASAVVSARVRAGVTGTLLVRAGATTASRDVDPDDDSAEASVRVDARAIPSTPSPLPRPRPRATTTTTSGPGAGNLVPVSTTVPATTTTARPASTTTRPGVGVATEQAAERESGGSNAPGVALGLLVVIVGAIGGLVLALRRVHQR